MTDLRHRPEPHAHRLGTVALLTAFAFGCTTIRAPVGAMQSPIPIEDGAAAPQLELWLESADPVSPEEAARVGTAARGAIEAALAGRQVADDGMLLVVRAQGVTRSASHRRDQTTAKVGLVVGAVVVVIGLVLLLTSGKGGGGGGGRAVAGVAGVTRHGGSGGVRPPPVSPALPVARGIRPGGASPPRLSPVRAMGAGAVAVRSPPVRPGPWPAPRPRPPPGPSHHHHDDLGGGVSWGLYVDPGPLVIQDSPQPWPEGYQVVSWRDLPAPAMEPPLVVVDDVEPAAEDEVAPPAPATAVALPAMPPLQVDERGFFDGDALTMELTLVDRITGAPRWTKWVEADVDPCDHAAVKKVLRKALDERMGWVAQR